MRTLLPPPRRLALLLAALVLVGLSPAATASPPVVGSELRLERVELDLEVWDAVAFTNLSVAIHNPLDAARELRFTLPLSPHAVLTSFKLTTHNETFRGIVLEKAAAEAGYNASRDAGQTAVVLHRARTGLISLTANVAAASTVHLEASYAEVLAYFAGTATYRFPLSSLLAAHGPVGVLRVAADVSFVRGWDAFALEGINAQPEITGGGVARIRYTGESITASEDLALRITPTAAGYVSTLALSERARNASFILSLLPPGAGNTAIPLDIVFVLDRSGSMDGEKIVQAKEALDAILGDLPTRDRIGLVVFDDAIDAWRPTLAPVDAATRQEARAWLESVDARGATDIEAALRTGLDLLTADAEGRLPVIVLITDGQPTSGLTLPADIVASVAAHNPRAARVHTVGIGFDQNDALLAELAETTRGHYAAVQPSAPVGGALEDFYERISTPILRDLRVTFPGARVWDLEPQPLPDLYQGSNLVMAGRIDAASLPPVINITLEARDAAGPVRFDLQVASADVATRADVPSLWARQRANALERAHALEEDEAERARLWAELLQVGLAHQVDTAATSWLIVALTVPLQPGQPIPEGPLDFELQADASGGFAATGTTAATTATRAGSATDPTGSAATTATTPTPPVWLVLAGLAAATLATRRRP